MDNFITKYIYKRKKWINQNFCVFSWCPYVFAPKCILRMQSEYETVYLDNKAAIFYKYLRHNTVTPIHSKK